MGLTLKSGKVGGKRLAPAGAAAKFGGVGLTQSLALDLAEYGITVHSFDARQPVEIADVPVAAAPYH